jgi:dihydroorotase (multifunctional complex type)
MPDHFDLIVRNGTLVSGSGRRLADIAIRDGQVVAVEPRGQLAGKATNELDATGRYVLPGLIDGHVHFRQPGLESKETWLTGSRAAVMGGVTTVLDMPNTVPLTDRLAAVDAKLRLAEAQAYCDFGLFGLLGADNEAELGGLTGHPSVVGFKAFLGPTTGDIAPPPDEVLLHGLAIARDAGLRVAFHAEDARLIGKAATNSGAAHLGSRPVAAEVSAIDRVGRLLVATGAAGHILHLSSADGLTAVQRWRTRGADVSCEVSAHHCFLSASDYARLDGLMVCNPPVREAGEGDALLAGLADGVVDCIASDHAPHAPVDKTGADGRPIAPGINGVETTLPLFLTGGVAESRLTLERLVSACAERPAQLWRLWPRKGSLEVGSDADLAIVDLEREGVIRGNELHGMHPLTPFEGWPVRGMAVATIVRGRLVMDEGRLVGEPGWGRPVGEPGWGRPVVRVAAP